MEYAILAAFAAMLILCISLDLSILYALAAGFVLFSVYAIVRGFTFREVMKMSLSGVLTVKNMLITFLLIGVLTGLWRAAGTIPAIVCFSVKLITPTVFIMLTFLLNCLVSFLTGTAFGTSATMGAVCMTIAAALGANPVMAGGAVLSGAYFGDRCSPVSTSALLVSELTHTDIYKNIREMIKTAAVPFAAASAAYLLMGVFSAHGESGGAETAEIFERSFRLGIVPLIPAAAILIPALCRVKVRLTMLASIAVSALVCLFWQGCGIAELLKTAVMGFHPENAELAAMLDGGGVVSMLKVTAIICLSSSYSGIFKETGLLDPMKSLISKAAQRTSSYAVMLPTSIAAGAISCNQTLTIMLTEQLCADAEPDAQKRAIYLENSAVVVPTLIPWSIAGAVSLSSAGAPMLSIVAACFLYFLPIWRLFRDGRRGGTR